MHNWDGTGSGPAILSRLIFDISEDVLMKSKFNDYRDIFNCCIALYWSLPVQPVQLDAEGTKAAFGLYKAIRGKLSESVNESAREEKAPYVRPRDLPTHDLPPYLSDLWEKIVPFP